MVIPWIRSKGRCLLAVLLLAFHFRSGLVESQSFDIGPMVQHVDNGTTNFLVIPFDDGTAETIVPTTATNSIVSSYTADTAGSVLKSSGFQYIFIIGSSCEDPNNWYSLWATAGQQTIQNVTQVICAHNGTEYTRDFHLNALRQVEEQVGDHLKETLVITVAVGLESDWTPVADLLRRGMAFFHAKEDPHNFDITEYGLSVEEIMYFYFQWDEYSAASSAGVELCRLHQGLEQLKVGKYYYHGRNGSLNYRVDLALDAFRDKCNETEIVELWAYEDDISNQTIEALLTFKRIPDVVLTCADHSARYFLEVAKQVLTPAQYSLLHTTGWNKVDEHLLNERKILTTVDQQVLYANRGLWKVINTVLNIIEKGGHQSTKNVQDVLLLGDSLTISADTLLVSSDQVGYLLDQLLVGYDGSAPPSRIVPVSTGLHNVTILSMLPFEGRFDAVIWLTMVWDDPRLQFDPTVYNDTLPVDSGGIWVPALFYQNEISHEELYRSPAAVGYDGTVTLEVHTLASFLCPTTDNLASFPFDQYACSIQLGAPVGITLDADLGFHIDASDPNFYTYESIYVTPSGQVVYYQLTFERKNFTAYVRLILPAILINMVGFMTFWIDSVAESIALGVTSLLCCLAFRDTVEVPETSDVTWTEVFMLINIFYQVSVLFIIWASYGRSKRVAFALDQCCKKVHPQRISGAFAKTNFIGKSGKEMQLGRSLSAVGQSLSSLMKPQLFRKKSIRTNTFPAHGISPYHNKAPQLSTQGLQLSTQGNKFTTESGNIRTSKIRTSNIRTPASGNSSNTTVGPDTLQKGNSRRMSIIQESGLDMGNNHGKDEQEVHHLWQYESYWETKLHGESNVRLTRNESQKGLALTDEEFKEENPESRKDPNPEEEEEDKGDVEPRSTNVDWIGRWFIVPSYIIVMTTLILTGWGFTVNN